MRVQGDWIDAEGTTLGADNGIGVATIMATLSSKDIAHPPLEALFTIDEETGMTGAKEMDGSLFNGEILLNLDTEDDDELSIGCAGGIDTNTSYQYHTIETPSNSTSYEIQIKGLLGGHSGMDIDSGRGNANKWMARILWNLSQQNDLFLDVFDGGGLEMQFREKRRAPLIFRMQALKNEASEFEKQKQILITEYKSIENNISIEISETSNSEKSYFKIG